MEQTDREQYIADFLKKLDDELRTKKFSAELRNRIIVAAASAIVAKIM